MRVPPQVCSTSSGCAARASTSSARRFSNGSLGSCMPLSVRRIAIARAVPGEDPNEQNAGEETADMREPGYALGLSNARQRTESAQDLQKEPIEEHEGGGYIDCSDENNNEDERNDPDAGIEDEKSAHHAGD